MDGPTGHSLLDVSPLIRVGRFLSEWQEAASKSDLSLCKETLGRSELARIFEQNEDVVAELEECCDEATLVCPAEEKYESLEDVSLKRGLPSGGSALMTLKLRCKAFAKPVPSQMFTPPKFSRGSYEMEYNHLDARLPDNESMVVQPAPNVLLQVMVYRSAKDTYKTNLDLNKERELLVLSGQKLTVLRDKIICAADLAWVTSDISDNPQVEDMERAQDVHPSNFFFIENTFYPDLRHPLATDISRPIQDWIKSKRPGIPTDFSVKHMTDVTFEDLTIRLGYPYLYCHQGDCEHLIVFSDLRLMHGDDCQDLSMYPVLVNKPSKKRILCVVCKTFPSKWMTRNDCYTPMDPSFQCDTCFKMLHYDQNGKKLGSFEAYPYIDAAIFN